MDMNLRNNNKKNKLVLAVLLLIGIIGIGYAALGANLQINGIADITSATWNVHFVEDSIHLTEGSVAITENTEESAASIDSSTEVSYHVKLTNPGDFYEFTVDVTNEGSIDAMIDSISSKIKIGDNEEVEIIPTGENRNLPSYLNYSVTYSDGVEIAAKQKLNSNATETFKVRVEFSTDIDAEDLPGTNQTLGLKFQVNYVQKDSTAINRPISISDGLNLGDYITMVPDSNSYSISSSVTGYYNYTINPSELTLWRVIKKNDDGTVDAVSHYVSSTEILFDGYNAYLNFVNTLQTIAQQYAKSGYTEKVREMGYDGQTLVIEDDKGVFGTGNAPSTTTTPTIYSGVGEEYENGLLGDTLYVKDYQLVMNVYGYLSAGKEGEDDGTSYWLASRKYEYTGRTNPEGDNFYFAGRIFNKYTNSLISIDIQDGYYSANRGDSYVTCSLRPVITLRSDVKLSEGTGEFDNPYTLTK